MFTVKNTGKVAHEFVVLATKQPAAALGNGRRIKEVGSVGETGDVKPSQSKTLTLTLRRGHYAVVCNIPGHYVAGMRKDISVS